MDTIHIKYEQITNKIRDENMKFMQVCDNSYDRLMVED